MSYVRWIGLIACSVAGLGYLWLGNFNMAGLLLALAVAFAASGVIRWWGRPGEGLFLIALMLSLVFLWLDARGARPEFGRRGVSR